MRVFFAIEVEEEIKNYLAHYQEMVQKNSVKGNFTVSDNFHLTLKFIGEVEEKNIEVLKEALDSLGQQHRSFHLTSKDIGSFPRGSKQIIWAGLEREPRLQKLYNDLEDRLTLLGYERESRPYRPHITLGREIILKDNCQDLQSMVKLKSKEIKVHTVSLMESARVKGRLTYSSLYSSVLKGGVVE